MATFTAWFQPESLSNWSQGTFWPDRCSWVRSETGFTMPASTFVTLYADARGQSRVLLVFSGDPVAGNPLKANDALNPATWTICRAFDQSEMEVVSVRRLASDRFELFLSEDLLAGVDYEYVPNPGLLDIAGQALDSENPIVFSGRHSSAEQARSRIRRDGGLTDLRNSPYPRSPAATLRVTASGSYSLSEGIETLDKRILRRTVTKKGSFWHLPDYGAGVDAKSLAKSSNLLRVKAQIEREMAKEEEVEKGIVRIESRPGVLLVTPRVKVRSSDNFQKTAGFEIPLED